VTSGHRTADVPGICLAGCGWWGSVHALELKGFGSRIRRYFASRDLSRAREFARRFDGQGAFGGLPEALADTRVDAVILALPHHLHVEAATLALKASRHVLVEKPVATSVAEAERLLKVAETSSCHLAVAEQYRLSPLVAKAKALLDDGLLGRVVFVHAGMAGRYRPEEQWKNARTTMGGGVLLDVGIHYVDVLRFWLGEPAMVWAATPPHLNKQMEGEDSILAVLRFPEGVVASLSLSWTTSRASYPANFEIVGENGTLELWFTRPYLQYTAPLPGEHWSQRLRRVIPWRLERRIRPLLPRSRRQRFRVQGDDLIGSRALLEDFVRAVKGETSPATPASEGLRDLRVVEAAYQSLEAGCPAMSWARPTAAPTEPADPGA